jgi:hypothetical protein
LGGGAAIGQAAPVNPVVPLTHTLYRLIEEFDPEEVKAAGA